MATIGTSWTQVDYWTAQYYDYITQTNYTAQLRLVAYVSSQSIANNTSDVQFKWQKRLSEAASGRSVYNNNTYTYNITCTGKGGESHSAAISFSPGTVSSASWTDVGGSNYWGSVTHSDDGTCTVSATATGYRFNGVAFSTSESITLPTIPRASNPTVSKNTVVLNGTDSLTINTNRASSSFTHTIKVVVGSNSATFNNVGASYSFAPTPSIWMPYMTSYSMTATVTCTTYNGTTQIGSAQTCTFTMQVDTSEYKPTINVQEISDSNPTTSALETSGTFIRGYSNLSLTVSFGTNNSDYDSALASATITCGNVSSTYSLSGTTGTVSFTRNGLTESSATVAVTDSRGYTVSSSVTLSVVAYSPVSIKTITCERANSSGVHSETGTSVNYKILCNVFCGSFGQVDNTVNVYSESKLATASTYDTQVLEQTLQPTGTGAVQTDYIIPGVTGADTYSASSAYDIKFTVTDALSTATITAIRVTEGIPIFAWGEDHFDVYGTLHVHDREDITDYLSITPQGGGLSGILKTQWFTSASVSCTANYASSVSINITIPTGYTYVGVIQTCSNGNIVPCYCNSSTPSNGAVTVWWRNPTSSAMNATFSVNVLFIRT